MFIERGKELSVIVFYSISVILIPRPRLTLDSARYYILRINHYPSGRFIQWIALSTFEQLGPDLPQTDNIQLFLRATMLPSKNLKPSDVLLQQRGVENKMAKKEPSTVFGRKDLDSSSAPDTSYTRHYFNFPNPSCQNVSCR